MTNCCYGEGRGAGVGRDLGAGFPLGATLTTPVMPYSQCAWQKYEYVPGCVKVCSYTVPIFESVPAWQFVSSGEQNCPLGMHGVPLVTLWPLLAHVQRTVSPIAMLTVLGAKVKP